jgi:hypothetical protein
VSGDGTESGGGAFSAKVIGAVIAVGVFAFAAFFVLSAWAPDLRRGSDGGSHALSTSAVGFAGLVRMLELQGEPVAVSRSATFETAASLWIATPGVGGGPGSGSSREDRREALNAFVDRHEEPILLVLPKWITATHERRPDWVRKGSLLDVRRVVEPMLIFEGVSAGVTRRPRAEAVELFDAKGRVGATGRIEQLQVLHGEGFQSLVEDGEGGTVLAYVARRGAYVLSDPDLLNTQGLAELAGARTASSLIQRTRAGAGPVVFDLSLNGFQGGRSLLKLAFAPPFLAATLCAALAAGLAGWQAAVRFGPRMRRGRAVALGAEALTDNAALLIRLSGREHRMASRYAELTEGMAARAVGAAPGEGAAERLDRLSAKRPGAPLWSSLRREAGEVRTREALLAAARRMHGWRRGVAGGN